VIAVDGAAKDQTPPRVTAYQTPSADKVYGDAVAKVAFSEPVRGVDALTFTLTDASGAVVPAAVDQIGPGTYGLFPGRIQLEPNATYTAHLAAGVCDMAGNCTPQELTWSFKVAPDAEQATGNTAIPYAFVTSTNVSVGSSTADSPDRVKHHKRPLTTKGKLHNAKGPRHHHA
jgi:hypothetical protein